MDFFAELAENAGIQLETAGVLKGGKVFWAMANTDDVAEISKGDVVKHKVLLASSCDKSMATTGKNTTVRTVCANTLDLALSGGAPFRKIHTSKLDRQEAIDVLGLNEARECFQAQIRTMRALKEQYVSDGESRAFFHTVLTGETEEERESDRAVRGLDQLIKTYHEGVGQQGIVGTKLGLVQAVSRYVDHERTPNNPDGRLHSAWFANGAQTKRQALGLALAMDMRQPVA